jgi:putative tryptophan/tyrosine transport system permease protein
MALILLGCLVGSITYRMVVALALNASAVGLQSADLNLVTAALVALAMILPKIRGNKTAKGR